MKVSRMLKAEDLGDKFFESLDFIIFGRVTEEERNTHLARIPRYSEPPQSLFFDYDLDSETYALLQAPFGTRPDDAEIDAARQDIVTSLRGQIRTIGLAAKNVLIDITGVSQPALFYLLKLLYEDINPRRLFLAYTEPLRYRERTLPSTDDMFDLTERLGKIKALPGFVTNTARGKSTAIALLIGFEGKRFNAVCEELEMDSDQVRVILGFPAFRPGWEYLAFGGNQSALEAFQGERYLWHAAANDPFEAYNILGDILDFDRNQGNDLVIAPIGTKPHAMGAALFAIHHPKDTRLVYDFPVKARHFRTEGVGTPWICNVTDLLLNPSDR